MSRYAITWKVKGLECDSVLTFIFIPLQQLLDDGTGRDPLEVYNFGKAAKYLFRPCQNEDGSPDEVRHETSGDVREICSLS